MESAGAAGLAACVNIKTGAWRTVSNAKKCKLKKETVEMINTTGQVGSQGLKGDTGSAGTAGAAGATGPKGDTGVGAIRVTDSSQSPQELGFLISNSGDPIDIYNPAAAAVVRLYADGSIDTMNSTAFPAVGSENANPITHLHQSNDCTGPSIAGPVYFDVGHVMQRLLKGATSGYFVYKKTAPATAPVSGNSYEVAAAGNCFAGTISGYTNPPSYTATPVAQMLNLTFPVTLPLKFD